MVVFAYVCVLVGCTCIMLGFANRTRKVDKGEKTTTGKVESFELQDANFFYGKKYKTVIKTKTKKYTIESVSMPWLDVGEEVLIQITGNQKVLGNLRLKNRAKLEVFIGIVIIIFPFVMFFSK